VLISVAAALLAQLSGTLVAFLGIFGWGLFASTLVPGAGDRAQLGGRHAPGAIASIATGLGITLGFETLAFFRASTPSPSASRVLRHTDLAGALVPESSSSSRWLRDAGQGTGNREQGTASEWSGVGG
jgi:hypothetical protein